MLRGMIFDSYDGVSWSQPSDDPVPLDGTPPYFYPVEQRSLGPRAEVSQTFYIEAEQPNAIFSAAYPDRIFYEGGVAVDALGGLRTGGTLSEGTVYSVVASRGAATPDQLRRLGAPEAPETMSRYLEVPSSVPKRVGALARRITASAETTYDKVKAIEDHMARNYRYSTDSPVPPEGRDAVDHFLFDTDVGFCEQFASATTVLLRSLDIPALAGRRLHARNPQPLHRLLRGSQLRRPRLGRGLLPLLGLVRVRSHLRGPPGAGADLELTAAGAPARGG